MIYLSEISLIACWIGMAKWQAWMISPPRNGHIYHGEWALLSAFLIAGAVFWVHPHTWQQIALYVDVQGGGRLVVFNVALNLFRKFDWRYTSPRSGSLMDRLEIWLFGSRVWIMEVIIGALFLALQYQLRKL